MSPGMLECRFCSKSFPAYDEDEFRRDGVITLSFSSVPYEHFGGRSKCSRNVLGTVEEKYHATRGGETCYWREGLGEWLTYDTDQGDTLWDGTPCVCGSSSRKAPGCATRTVKVKGPHEPAPFWTMELHCRVPSVLSAPARKFVLFVMFVGEAMDRDVDAPAVWSTPFNSPAEAVAFNASLADALPASSEEDERGRGRRAGAEGGGVLQGRRA